MSEERPSRLSSGIKTNFQKKSSNNVVSSIPVSKDEIRERYNRQRDLSKIKVIPAKVETNPFSKTTRKRVVVYCRVSTDGIQQTTSFELQKNYYLRFVRKKPEWKLVGMYSDEGITATSTEHRIGLLTMLDDAREGKFDIIVVKNLSRFCRNLMDCMNIIYELRSLPHPVGILFETENMFTLDKNVDFTLQVLSLVAQEESHKKSEAMNSSYQQRFSSGQFTKPDLLGYDRCGVNEIAVNETEAQTVQLIFMMYLAGIQADTIASVLTELGRKTHTHKYKDGRVKEGVVKWTRNSVINVLKNERRCGDVLAQKTYTPNYLDHKARKNDNALPKYYAQDQHPAIVAREDFLLVKRILEANKGGWEFGLPELTIYESGPLKGFVDTIPNWKGFSAEDYNRASLRGRGVSEEELDKIDERIAASLQSEDEESTVTPEFQHTFNIDSDDYESFPDQEIQVADLEANQVDESFKSVVDNIRNSEPIEAPKSLFGTYDFTGCELVRPELFSTLGKVALTADKSGLYFSSSCSGKLDAEHVRLSYNPVEQILIVRKAIRKTASSIHWLDVKKSSVKMRRCACKGLAESIYENMGWNNDYKYKIIGSTMEIGGQQCLVFCLPEHIIRVRAKEGIDQNLDTDESRKQQLLFDDEVSDTSKIMARSRAIYYDELTEKSGGEIHLSDLGNERFRPECIQRLIEKGIKPVEGWSYLEGMATIQSFGFTIFPEDWADSFGSDLYHNSEKLFRIRIRLVQEESTSSPYGWTVGLDLPSLDTVKETIRYLKVGEGGT